jgi:general secretion pathway protein G
MVNQQRRQNGFTLIEIMVVIVIIGIMAALVVPNLMGQPHDARVAKVKHDLQQLESALEMYKLDNVHYPSTDQGLESLVSKPSGDPEARRWRQGGYIKRLPKYPWGNDYQFLAPGEHGDLDIYSLGADNAIGGDAENADIGNWIASSEAGQ